MLRIIKIGGNIVDNSAKLQSFLADFAALEGDKILVHGGGKVATAISSALGIATTMIDGRRVTDARTLEVVTMVYNGINKQIVSTLQSLGCDAVGLCGADGRLIVSRRRAPAPVDYGFVGDPVSVNSSFVRSLLAEGQTLVVAPITLDMTVLAAALGAASSDVSAATTGVSSAGVGTPNTIQDVAFGGLLNTNADTVAQTLAVALAGSFGTAQGASTPAPGVSSAAGLPAPGASNVETAAGLPAAAPGDVELVYCFEKQGVMLDIDDPSTLIPRIDRTRFAALKASGAVHSGMLPKLENAFRALDAGVGRVVICAAENIARPGYGGTTICRDGDSEF